MVSLAVQDEPAEMAVLFEGIKRLKCTAPQTNSATMRVPEYGSQT